MNEERAAAGVDHLQTAALELISAVRAFLDVAEEVVSSNEHLDDVTRVVTSVAHGVQRAAGFDPPAGSGPSAGPDRSTGASSGEPTAADPASPDVAASGAPPPGPSSGPTFDGVQHIRVS